MFFWYGRNRRSQRVGHARRRGAPSGFGRPTVVSSAVWRSISEFSSAPHSTMMADIHIHIIRPIAAPSEP